MITQKLNTALSIKRIHTLYTKGVPVYKIVNILNENCKETSPDSPIVFNNEDVYTLLKLYESNDTSVLLTKQQTSMITNKENLHE